MLVIFMPVHARAPDPDHEPPIINYIRLIPENPDANEDVTFRITITDDCSGVAVATLRYSVDDGPWQSIMMTRTTGGFTTVWEGTVPGQESGTTVRYLITATDYQGNQVVADNAGEYYNYTVVPEFSTWVLLLVTLSALTLAVFLFKGRIPSLPNVTPVN